MDSSTTPSSQWSSSVLPWKRIYKKYFPSLKNFNFIHVKFLSITWDYSLPSPEWRYPVLALYIGIDHLQTQLHVHLTIFITAMKLIPWWSTTLQIFMKSKIKTPSILSNINCIFWHSTFVTCFSYFPAKVQVMLLNRTIKQGNFNYNFKFLWKKIVYLKYILNSYTNPLRHGVMFPWVHRGEQERKPCIYQQSEAPLQAAHMPFLQKEKHVHTNTYL
jgi:hypothetical protein